MINTKIKYNSGFIALMSAIILSVVLLLVAVNLSFTAFYSRSNILDFEFKERSSALAEACVDKAILNLSQGSTFIGDVVVDSSATPNLVCNIESISGGSSYTIFTKGEFPQTITERAVTYLKVRVEASDFSVISWEEI